MSIGAAGLTKKANDAAGVTESVAARLAQGLLFFIGVWLAIGTLTKAGLDISL